MIPGCLALAGCLFIMVASSTYNRHITRLLWALAAVSWIMAYLVAVYTEH